MWFILHAPRLVLYFNMAAWIISVKLSVRVKCGQKMITESAIEKTQNTTTTEKFVGGK